MCVTNTTFRRTQPVTLPPTAAQDAKVSGLTQRLMGTFQLAAAVKPQQQQQQPQAQLQQTFDFFPQPNVSSAAPAAFQPPMSSAGVACSSVPQLATTNGKPRPKRRRKPQKPGKTAKMNDRHFVIHNYHDHARDTESDTDDHSHDGEQQQQHRKGGVAVAFPLKLHAILDQVERDGLAHVISWQPHGRCFVIHQPKIFVESVMPKYFRQTKLTSFQRQLNLYGFSRLTRGNDAGGYYHELFLRGKTFLTKKMTRTKVKGTKFKAASSPDQEPDFYRMAPVAAVTPATSPMSSPMHTQDDTISEAPIPAGGFDPTTFPGQQQHVGSVLFQQNPPQNVMEPYPFRPEVAAPPPTITTTTQGSMITADQVLDQAVEELFLDSGSSTEVGDLDDFVRDWDPNNQLSQTLENDVQLGYMLDRLLED